VSGGTFHQLIAASIIVLLILIPFFAFRSLGEVVGERTLLRLFSNRVSRFKGRKSIQGRLRGPPNSSRDLIDHDERSTREWDVL
jgi:hypothetical protein